MEVKGCDGLVSGGWQPLTRLFNGPKVHHYTDCAPSRFQLGAGRRRRGGPFGFAQRRLRPPLTHSIAGNRRGLVHLASAARRSLPVRLSGRLLRVVGRVLLNKLFLDVWDVFECMNRVGGAGRDATAVDAALGIDVHLGSRPRRRARPAWDGCNGLGKPQHRGSL